MEFNFNLKTAKIFQALKWYPVFRFAKPLKKLFLTLFFIFFLLFLYGFFAETLTKITLSFTLGLSIILLVLAVAQGIRETFFNLKLKLPRLRPAGFGGQGENLAEFLSFEAARAVWKTNNNSADIFYNLLCQNPELNFILSRALLRLSDIKKLLKTNRVPSSADFEKVILEALKVAQEKPHQRVEVGDMITALSRHDPLFKQILIENNLKSEDIENLTWWLEHLKEKIEQGKRFWQWKNLLKKGSLAKAWAAGYTITLDKFSTDLSEMVKRQGFPEIIGHQKEIKETERILARREKNNVLIVGEPGSGRKSIVQALAVKSVLGESLTEVNYKRVVRLELPSLISQTNGQEEAETILDAIFREAISAGNIILVIDDFHNFLNIAGVISPYLALPNFQVVALTTFEGLHKNLEQDSSLLNLFDKVEVAEISEKETLLFLENLVLYLERKYKVFVSYPALRDIINYCSKYMGNLPFPEKATKVLDEAVVHVSREKEKFLLPKHIAKIITEKTQIPVGEIDVKEKEVLLNLENLIHQKIINQEEAVREVSSALRRARAEITIRKGPMGSFLFLGPTGVGKTETTKALAEVYFGSAERMIRLDMSEFQNVTDVPRLLGSPGQEGFLTTRVREAPFSLLLLDELEKAHQDILNLFLQVLDEGNLTDGLGRKVSFKNTIIIATSNAGYQIILAGLKAETEWPQVKEKLLDFIFEKAIFRPEFINRFDAVVVFKPLNKENLLAIAELLLKKIKKGLAEKEIEFLISQPLKEKIVELGYDPTFGARSMQRVIQDKIGNALASAILSGQLKRGDRVEVNPEGFSLKINL